MNEEAPQQPDKQRFPRIRGIVERVWGSKPENATMDPYQRFQSRLDALPPGDLRDQHQQLFNKLRELYPDPNDPMASYNVGLIEGGLRTVMSLPGQLDEDWVPQKELIDGLIEQGSRDIDELREGLAHTKYPDAREPSIGDAQVHMDPMPPQQPGRIIQPPEPGSN